MTALKILKEFLRDVPNISLGYQDIKFFAPDKLEEEQIGYRVDTDNNSLIGDAEGDWKEEWFAIGNDNLGDPIIVDTSEPSFVVMTAMHGEGEWEPGLIAESLEKFKNIILQLKALSKKRTTPVEFEKNPIPEKEQLRFMKNVEDENPNIDIDYWSMFMEN